MKYLKSVKSVLTAFLFIIGINIYAQTFTEQTGIVLPGVFGGNTVWGDSDNDGDLDILIAGYTNASNNPLTVKLFRNDGNDSFVDLGAIFSPAIPSHYYNYMTTTVSWVDFNNDGYLDILYNSINSSSGNIVLIYKNEGNNTFTLKWSLNYIAVQTSSADWGDYDNDGDYDFVLNTNSSIRLFQNQGNFTFSEQTPVDTEGLSNGTIKFGDYDNDNDLDLLVSGVKAWNPYVKLYRNDNNNKFTLLSGTNFPGINPGCTEWGDFNNDGQADLLVAGYYYPVYQNMGNNTFSPAFQTNSDPFTNGTGKWGDLDNDGDLDFIIAGDNYGNLITKIYINNGDETFTTATGITIDAVKDPSIDLGDYDNDGDLDILISGSKGTSKITKVYKNVSATVNASPSAPTGLTTTMSGSDVILSWNAVTTDNTPANGIYYTAMAGTTPGAINLISPQSSAAGLRRLPGFSNGQPGNSIKLHNIKKGTYYWKVQAVDNSFRGSSFSAEAFFTYSSSVQAFNLNVPVTGAKEATLAWTRGNGTNCIVFMKEANTGTASPVNNTTYNASTIFKSGTQISTSGWYCVAKGNINSVNVTGLKAKTDYIFQVIEYEGNTGAEAYNTQSNSDNPKTFRTGIFTEEKASALLPVNSDNPGIEQTSSSFWLDFDNDNDLDLLLAGMNATKLYRNDLNGLFTESSVSFASLVFGAACGDFNNDGWVDIITSGDPIHFYKNNGNSTFTDITSHGLPGNTYGSVNSGDFDNDGDLDIAITGETTADGRITKIYKNNGNNTFTEQSSVVLPGVNGIRNCAKFGDYNNDNLEDLIVSGYDNSATFITKLYKSTGTGAFQEISGISIPAQFESSFDWGDYDSDGDLDLLVATSGSNSLVYRNDGNDTFTMLSGLNLKALRNGSGIWGDYDSDGDADILICGMDSWYSPFIKIYRNDGNDLFTEEVNAAIPGAHSGSAAWGDYDNDGDLDFSLSGLTGNSAVSKIYRNDLNQINNKPSAPAEPAAHVNKSDVTLKWRPVKSDNTNFNALTYNLRVGTISGTGNIVPNLSSATGYRRLAAQGNALLDTAFTLKKLPFGNYYWSVQAVDNGFAGGTPTGEGTFSIVPVQSSKLSAKIISSTSLLLKWDRGNGDRCIVFCKQTSSGSAVPVNNTTYAADSELGFGTQIGSTGWYCVYNGRNDSITVTGLTASKMYSFHIFEYTGNYGSEQYFTQVADGNPGVFSTSIFTEQTGITLNSAPFMPVPWGDYDNDGFIDFVLPGFPTRIYRNNGNNTFTEKTAISLAGVNNGGAAWGDYDNDDDLDLIMTGGTVNTFPPSSPVTKLYRNDGGDIFTERTDLTLPQLYYSSAEWGDFDNDGDLDLLLTGATGADPNFAPVSGLYENNGSGSFTERTQVSLQGVYRGTGKWVDYDSDGYLDIVLNGAVNYETTYSTNGIIKFYHNNGDKSFTEQNQTGAQGYSNAVTTWGDFDNDSDPDFIISSLGYMKLYQNQGNCTFSQQLFLNLPYQNACAAAWGDYDNDGYLDFIVSNPGLDTKIFHNTQGISTPGAISQWFNRQDDSALGSIGYGFVNWVDYDNDGDLDFLMGRYGYPTKIFKNNTIMKSGAFKVNNAPSKPSGLDAKNTPSGILLKWNPVSYDETGRMSMTYNIAIGITKSTFDRTPSHSTSDGFLRIPSNGNAELNTTHVIKNLPPQKLYWKVQAVDQSFKGGAWSTVDSFEVKNVLAFFEADTVCQGLNTTFTNQSVGFGETITNYKWIFENGATSVQANPTYTFASEGVKNVTLIAYSSNTSDTLVKQILVKGKPITDFTSTVACLGTETEFTNISDITGLTISSWSWDYGDGKGSTAMNPGSHGYLNPGDYDVILTATADNGCQGTVTKTVTVAAFPIASISATTPLSFCSGDSVVLSVNSYSNHTYNWLSNGFSITDGNTNKLTARMNGSYSVEVVNLTGNCKTISPAAAVTVLNAPASPVITASGSTICQGDSLRLEVSNTAGYRYQWKLNGGAIGSDLNSHYARNAGTYTLMVSNSFGCSVTSSNSVPVTVNPVPVVGNISHSGDTRFCNNQTIILSVPANSAYTYNWKRGTVETGNKTSSMTASQSGDYSVEATNTLGCRTVSLPITLEVVSRPAKPEIDYGSFRNDDCLGETPLKLSVKNIAPEYTYKWYLNGTPVSTGTSIETRKEGKYVLEANYDICKSDTAEMTIRLKATLPKPEIKAYGPSVWFLTTASNAFSYKWYHNGTIIPGATGNTYVAGSKTGIYMLAVADNSGCYSYSDTLRISQSVLTGIKDAGTLRKLVLYPSPNKGKFTLSMENNLSGNVKISIFAQSGRKVLDREFEKTEEKFSQQIDISGVGVGLYVISLYINGQFLSTRFIIEK